MAVPPKIRRQEQPLPLRTAGGNSRYPKDPPAKIRPPQGGLGGVKTVAPPVMGGAKGGKANIKCLNNRR